MRCWRKVFRGAAEKQSAFDPIGRGLCHGKDVRDRVHSTGISAADGTGAEETLKIPETANVEELAYVAFNVGGEIRLIKGIAGDMCIAS
jgi:hypothetical protein